MSDGLTAERGHVYHGQLSPTEVAEQLKDWFAGEERVYLAAFRPDDRQLRRFDLAEAEALTKQWNEGRVFSGRREVRWRRRSEKCDVWLLTEDHAVPPELKGMREILAEPNGWQLIRRTGPQQGIFLWGQYKELEDSWVEVRLPWMLQYPVNDDQRQEDAFVRIGYLDYRAPNGAVQFTRLVEVR